MQTPRRAADLRSLRGGAGTCVCSAKFRATMQKSLLQPPPIICVGIPPQFTPTPTQLYSSSSSSRSAAMLKYRSSYTLRQARRSVSISLQACTSTAHPDPRLPTAQPATSARPRTCGPCWTPRRAASRGHCASSGTWRVLRVRRPAQAAGGTGARTSWSSTSGSAWTWPPRC